MDINKLIKELKEDILVLIKDKFKKEGQTIASEIDFFLVNTKEKLKRWSLLLAQEEITPEEFNLLLRSQKDLLQMKALHKAGISAIKLGHFKNTIIKLIFSKVTLLLGL